MNIKAIWGYLLSTGLLESYKKDEKKLSNDIILLQNELLNVIKKYKKHFKTKEKLEAEMTKAWNILTKIAGENAKVDAYSFLLQFIRVNPYKMKHKVLTNIAEKLAKQNLFKKDEHILKAKTIVNKFYKKDIDE